MKHGYELKSLGEICDMYQPKTISKKELSSEGKYYVYGANGIIGRYDKYNHEESEVIIACRGTCGTVNKSLPKSWITGNSMVVKPRTSSLDKECLYYILEYVNLDETISGTAQPQITRQNLSPVKIPHPPLKEQYRIVTILDQAFESIEKVRINMEANLANTKELYQSIIEESLSGGQEKGWKLNPLREICEIKTGKKNVAQGNPEGLYPFFTCAKEHTYSDSYSFNTEAILIAGNGDVGTAKYYEGKFEVYQRTYVLLNFKKASPKYLYSFLSHKLKPVASQLKLGNTMPYIRLGMLESFEIMLPPLKEQQHIIDKLDKLSHDINKLEHEYQNQLNDLEDLRYSLLQKAFAGELT